MFQRGHWEGESNLCLVLYFCFHTFITSWHVHSEWNFHAWKMIPHPCKLQWKFLYLSLSYKGAKENIFLICLPLFVHLSHVCLLQSFSAKGDMHGRKNLALKIKIISKEKGKEWIFAWGCAGTTMPMRFCKISEKTEKFHLILSQDWNVIQTFKLGFGSFLFYREKKYLWYGELDMAQCRTTTVKIHWLKRIIWSCHRPQTYQWATGTSSSPEWVLRGKQQAERKVD